MGRKKISITPITDERNKQVIIYVIHMCLIMYRVDFQKLHFSFMRCIIVCKQYSLLTDSLKKLSAVIVVEKWMLLYLFSFPEATSFPLPC